MHVQLKLTRAIYSGCVCEVDPKYLRAKPSDSLGLPDPCSAEDDFESALHGYEEPRLWLQELDCKFLHRPLHSIDISFVMLDKRWSPLSLYDALLLISNYSMSA